MTEIVLEDALTPNQGEEERIYQQEKQESEIALLQYQIKSSAMVFDDTIEVGHAMTKKIVGRIQDFDRFSMLADRFAIFHGKGSNVSSEVETLISDELKKTEDAIDKLIGQINNLIKIEKVSHLATPASQQTLKYTFCTPMTARFANLVKKMDSALIATDTLWLKGITTSAERQGYTHELCTPVSKLTVFVMRLQIKMRHRLEDKFKKDNDPAATSVASGKKIEIPEPTKNVEA